ncbi:MAG: type II toxin-antitoxin system VapC family toxin [Flavobacteriales bacterium]|nr:type II toxin-antitoxin system VapC family toxin [Flavobacteriales bacterium]
MEVLALTTREVRLAASLQANLRRRRIHVALPDLLIAATAMEAGLPVATLNKKHFEAIPGIKLYAGA